MIERRAFISGLLSLAGAPAFARAETQPGLRKIGYLHPAGVGSTHPTLAILRPVWQRLGYVEGETVLLRSAEGDPRRLPELLTELISLEVGVLIVFGSLTVRVAAQATKTTPIVAVDLESNPINTGLAASFARPGGNVTGLFLDQPSLAGKWLELLREAAPLIERVALAWDPSTGPDQVDAAKSAARTMGIETLVVEVRTPEEFEAACRSLHSERKTGVVQLSSAALGPFRGRLAEAALKYRLPTISFLKFYAEAGALMTYGPNLEVYFPRAMVLADKILKGEKPGDLPIGQPDRYELVINLKTAKALGIIIPPTLLARADELIE